MGYHLFVVAPSGFVFDEKRSRGRSVSEMLVCGFRAGEPAADLAELSEKDLREAQPLVDAFSMDLVSVICVPHAFTRCSHTCAGLLARAHCCDSFSLNDSQFVVSGIFMFVRIWERASHAMFETS